jgi:hypothetical protein
MSLLYAQKDEVGGFTEDGVAFYWTSNESSSISAAAIKMYFNFPGSSGIASKSSLGLVRPIRAF